MSVINFSKEELTKIGNSILALQKFGTFNLKLFDNDEIELLKKAYKWDEDKCIQQLTEWFMTKWSLVNQMAFFYQYHEHKDFSLDYNVFDLNEFHGLKSDKKLYSEICSLEYNCIDNNGNDFTPGFIAEKVQKIKNYIAQNEIIKDIEKNENISHTTAKKILSDIKNLAVNEDTKSQLVLERDSFDKLAGEYN